MTHESFALVTLPGVIRSCSSESSETDEKGVTLVPDKTDDKNSSPARSLSDLFAGRLSFSRHGHCPDITPGESRY